VDRARWLSEWLSKVTAMRISAKPMLALPGWYVVPKGIGAVTVVNHKQVPGAILRCEKGVLTREQIERIAAQIELRCRDVED
jgi:hypothetical protein